MIIEVFNFGGGRQSLGILVLLAQEAIARPDRIVIVDTGRENTSTWDFLDEVARPYAERHGMVIERAPRNLSYVDLHGHNGDLLIPVYTRSGKLKTFCSWEWKIAVTDRYMKISNAGVNGIDQLSQAQIRALMRSTPTVDLVTWMGFSLDERHRVKDTAKRRFPLIELNMTTQDVLRVITEENLPIPPQSSCYMCPNKRNVEWRYIRDHYPDDWRAACALDTELRADDEAAYDLADDTTRAAKWPKGPGVWLHRDRVPLAQADLAADETATIERQCGLGVCFV